MNAQIEQYAQAVAALNQRRWQEAWELAQRLLRQGEHAGVHFVAGVAAFEMQQMRAALAHLHRATELNPQRADYAAQMARALAQARLNRQAMEFADKAMAMEIDDAFALDTLGVVYTRGNEHAKALMAYEKAVRLAPRQASFRYNLATGLLFFGRVEEAEREYRQVLADDPRYWRAYTSLAQLRRRSPEDNDLPQLEQALQLGDGVAEATLYVNLALAKECEDLGDYHRAFQHYVQGKATQKRARRYDGSADRALFEAIERAFPEGVAAGPGYDSEEPIFVVGMPRSGTTLVERILSSHSQVHSAGELQNFSVALKRARGTATPGILDIPTLTELEGLDWQRVGREYVESTRPGTGHTPRFVDKLPHNFLYVGHIARALPKARIICLRRDPMDTCLGNFRQLFALSSPYYDYSFDLMDVGRYYLMFDRLMAHWRRLLPDRFLEVRYEDLVASQRPVTERLLAFCGLPWEEACMAFERNEAPVATASLVQVREPISSAYLGRWRRYGQDMAPLAQLLGVAMPA